MSEGVSNDLIYAVLQKVQADVADTRHDIKDLQTRMSAVEEHIGGLFITTSGINARLDRVVDRIERIERRLDLMDHE